MYDDSGVAINGATVNLLDRNTTTPVRATTTTNASGYWTISHATEGRFDVELVNGSSKRRHKYDAAIQVLEIETANLLVRNPAFTFKYDIVPAAITADRQLNLPLLTATDTLAVLALAQTFLTGVKTFNSSILAIRNPADTFSYTIAGGAITAARTITLPLLTGNDVLVTEAMAQPMTNKTMGGTPAVVLSTTAAAGVATTYLRTDDQLIAFDATVPVTQASADAAATGTAAVAARRDHKHGMPTISTGALTRAGGNTTEATTTSTTAVDSATVSTLSLGAIVWEFFGSFRRSTAGTGTTGVGLKINTTVVAEAVAGTAGIAKLTQAAAEASGMFRINGGNISSLYLASLMSFFSEDNDITRASTPLGSSQRPNATITDLVMRLIVGNVNTTGAIDELHVYSYAAS